MLVISESISSDTYNLIPNPNPMYNLILNLKVRIFRKTNVSTRLYKNGHNFTCDQYFFMKLAPLDSAHTELSIHAKNSVFMKNCEWSIFPYNITGHYYNGAMISK